MPLIFFILLLTGTAQAGTVSGPAFDHSEWDQFLKKFVNELGEVDYLSAGSDSGLLDAYLEKLKSIPSDAFPGWPREEKMAVLINAYNAGAVKLVLDHYPLKGLTDIPGVWDQTSVVIGNKRGKPGYLSLNQIQKTLRTSFRDEKVLFAITSAARGSPRLMREAYTGPKLEGQLYLAARQFVNDGEKNRIEPGEKKIVLSRLFQWYGSDFLLNWSNFPEEVKWKPQEMAALSFLAHTLEDPKKVEFLKEAEYKVKYHVFDWSLNGPSPEKTSA